MIDSSLALGTGKIVAVVALDAPHPHLTAAAPRLQQGRCLAVSVAASWTGASLAEWLRRLIAVMGRPAASLQDGARDLHTAIDLLEEQGLARPAIDDLSHAVATMLKRRDHDHPQCATLVSACGRVAGKLTHTRLACLAPPTGRPKARCMHGHRLVTWADRVLQLSPAGGAKAGSTLAKWRACLAPLPAWKALLRQCRADAVALLDCQTMLKTPGLSHDTVAPCEPLIDTIPSGAVRRELTTSLHSPLQTATTLGLDPVGLPMRSDPIAALFGFATQHGVGEIKDAGRMALRLPALCGVPTRQEAQQVLDVSVAEHQAITAQCPSLIQQRREVVPNPDALESLGMDQASLYVARIPGAKNRSNKQEIVNLSNGSQKAYGPEMHRQDVYYRPESAVS